MSLSPVRPGTPAISSYAGDASPRVNARIASAMQSLLASIEVQSDPLLDSPRVLSADIDADAIELTTLVSQVAQASLTQETPEFSGLPTLPDSDSEADSEKSTPRSVALSSSAATMDSSEDEGLIIRAPSNSTVSVHTRFPSLAPSAVGDLARWLEDESLPPPPIAHSPK